MKWGGVRRTYKILPASCFRHWVTLEQREGKMKEEAERSLAIYSSAPVLVWWFENTSANSKTCFLSRGEGYVSSPWKWAGVSGCLCEQNVAEGMLVDFKGWVREGQGLGIFCSVFLWYLLWSPGLLDKRLGCSEASMLDRPCKAMRPRQRQTEQR